MLTVRKPAPELIRRYIVRQSGLPFTYPEVGATAGAPPRGFNVDHTRLVLGKGEAAYRRAGQALREWKQFSLGWVETWPRNAPIEVGSTVAVIARAWGTWWLNAARIVYIVDEAGEDAQRFGFAYGTLPGHVEMGEERFLVEWDRKSDDVYYDLFAFSRPRHPLARIGRWQVRRLQRRFAADSAAAMRRVVIGDKEKMHQKDCGFER